MSVRDVTTFVDHINALRSCRTPGCSGSLELVSVNTAGLGGALSLGYRCGGCGEGLQFETLSHCNEVSGSNDISVAVQVAFIVAGCMHSTYYKTLKLALGMSAVTGHTFLSTIKKMHPIVKQMVDEMCERAKREMKDMDQEILGSWSRAVTTADGVWMTRGWHSKNASFSIRNYANGALLFYLHLCQRARGKDEKEELYQGTSKSAEGYAARKTFTKAKEEGMNVEVHWQDADSSSSNALAEIFPEATIMICGGHAGRAHMKVLEGRAKRKAFSSALRDKYRTKFPQVDSVVCHCEEKHRPGCGCLSKCFIEKARNNFSLILSQSQTVEEFSKKVNALARHARDEHEWEGGSCDFHSQLQCSCGKCKDQQDLKCPGKRYETRHKLSCPFHSLAYTIECYERSQMADQLVHPVLKRGHSNWVEASHNVLIRFRAKHINLEKLHYEVSTNLGLLQANMTYMYHQLGPDYHWIPDLYKRLKLPVFEGIEQALKSFNEQRMSALLKAKTDDSKKRRLHLKIQRKKERVARKEWSKKHGHDTYGAVDEDLEHDHTMVKGVKHTKKVGRCKCGSTAHKRSSHKDCPLNKQGTAPHHKDGVSSDTKEHKSADTQPHCLDSVSDRESLSEDTDGGTVCSEDEPIECGHESFDDYVITELCDKQQCKCGAFSRGHKRTCPLSSRNRYSRRSLFPDDALCVTSDSTCSSPVPTKGVGEFKGDSDSMSQKPPPAKRRKGEPPFRVGDYVFIHSTTLVKQHVPCRIVQMFGKSYKLYCQRGVLRTNYLGRDLMAMAQTSNCSIPLDKWREAPMVSLRDIKDDPNCLESCNCILSKSDVGTIDLTGDSVTESDGWVKDLLYSLTPEAKNIILSSSNNGWLDDEIIAGAQRVLQQYDHTLHGLQSPILQSNLSFNVHKGKFVQILHVGGNHWVTVSNILCEDEVVNLYDSLHHLRRPANELFLVIASLVHTSASELVIRTMDVQQQKNGSDCGIFAIAFAHCLCTGLDPCTMEFDHSLMRPHLADCLEKCCFSPFPAVRRVSKQILRIHSEALHCTCRLPDLEVEGYCAGPWAQCDTCEVWYHQHCVDIPSHVFVDSDNKEEVPWTCTTCHET